MQTEQENVYAEIWTWISRTNDRCISQQCIATTLQESFPVLEVKSVKGGTQFDQPGIYFM
jgi:hypothetical protein